jgi:DNA-binding IscR family transcriptional regulator
MNSIVINFIHARRIDSFQKLRLLLFMHQHPQSSGTSQEFAERLYLNDVSLLEKIVSDLQRVGLLDFVEGRYTLLGEPVLKSELQCLIKAFEDPLTRQELLNQVGYEWRSTPHKVQA